ncbi:hypothetical protein H8959_004896 [Pygathrix nigripes]
MTNLGERTGHGDGLDVEEEVENNPSHLTEMVAVKFTLYAYPSSSPGHLPSWVLRRGQVCSSSSPDASAREAPSPSALLVFQSSPDFSHLNFLCPSPTLRSSGGAPQPQPRHPFTLASLLIHSLE